MLLEMNEGNSSSYIFDLNIHWLHPPLFQSAFIRRQGRFAFKAGVNRKSTTSSDKNKTFLQKEKGVGHFLFLGAFMGIRFHPRDLEEVTKAPQSSSI